MIPLTTREQLDKLLCGDKLLCDDKLLCGYDGAPQQFLIWFSAAWCRPCQAMEKPALDSTALEMAIPLYYCDETVVEGAAEIAGIKTFPTFVLYRPKEEVARRISADTAKVCQWIRKNGHA